MRRKIILDLLKSVMAGMTASKTGLARRVFKKRKSLTSRDNLFCTLSQADVERESPLDKREICEFAEAAGSIPRIMIISNAGRIVFLLMIRRDFLKEQ
jgi:hypothetical protein